MYLFSIYFFVVEYSVKVQLFSVIIPVIVSTLEMRIFKELSLKFCIRLTWNYLSCLLSQKHFSNDLISKRSKLSYKLLADSLSLSVQTVTSVSKCSLVTLFKFGVLFLIHMFSSQPHTWLPWRDVKDTVLLIIHLT